MAAKTKTRTLSIAERIAQSIPQEYRDKQRLLHEFREAFRAAVDGGVERHEIRDCVRRMNESLDHEKP